MSVSNEVLDLEVEEISYLNLHEAAEQGTVQSGILPEIVSMQAYILAHYGKQLKEELCAAIHRGLFGKMTVQPSSVRVTKIFFTRADRYEVRADLYLTAVCCPANGAAQSLLFHADMLICMFEDEETQIEYGNFTEAKRICRRAAGVPLDEYLVPFYGRDDVEKASEGIFQEYAPTMLLAPKNVSAARLAAIMGLEVRHVHLAKRKHTASILFFEAGKVVVLDEDDEAHESEVPGNTIVINDDCNCNLTSGDISVFHECFHYAEHYLFFRLQRLYHSDLTKLAKWKPNEQQKPINNPIANLERQAHQGSRCLSMPASLVKPRIREVLQKKRQSFEHDGMRLDKLCRDLAEEFTTAKSIARARAISLGYVAAKGALNFVDNHYIRPYAFSAESCRGSYTFTISMRQMIRLYLSDSEFHNQIDTGSYVYVEGHICCDSEKYVVRYGSYVSMTQYGNAHVDECCLRFQIVYVRDQSDDYCYGQLNSDQDYNEQFISYDRTTQDKPQWKPPPAINLTEVGENIRHFREAAGLSQQELASMLDTTGNTISRYENGTVEIGVTRLCQLAVALHVTPGSLLPAASPETQPTGRCIISMLDSLSEEERKEVVRTMELIVLGLHAKSEASA